MRAAGWDPPACLAAHAGTGMLNPGRALAPLSPCAAATARPTRRRRVVWSEETLYDYLLSELYCRAQCWPGWRRRAARPGQGRAAAVLLGRCMALPRRAAPRRLIPACPAALDVPALPADPKKYIPGALRWALAVRARAGCRESGSVEAAGCGRPGSRAAAAADGGWPQGCRRPGSGMEQLTVTRRHLVFASSAASATTTPAAPLRHHPCRSPPCTMHHHAARPRRPAA